MIGQLTGKPVSYTQNALILDVRGVGYKIFASPNFLKKALQIPKLTLYTHTYVRDDTLDLYGFESLEQLKLFELIINISGIGPKTAILLMDKGVGKIQTAVSKADVDFFKSVPRLGKKTAQKIIIELKPKLGDLEDLDLTDGSSETKDIIEALISLGFTKNQARKAIEKIDDPCLSLENKIKQALKNINTRNT